MWHSLPFISLLVSYILTFFLCLTLLSAEPSFGKKKKKKKKKKVFVPTGTYLGIIIAYILCSQKDLVVILRQRTNSSVSRVELRSDPPLYRGMCRHSASNHRVVNIFVRAVNCLRLFLCCVVITTWIFGWIRTVTLRWINT